MRLKKKMKKMNRHIRVSEIKVNGKNYWQLKDLPHVILKADSKKELQEKIMEILPSYLKEFPTEQDRILEVPEMQRIPLKI